MGVKKPRNHWLTLNKYRNNQFHLNSDLKILFDSKIDLPAECLIPFEPNVEIEYKFFFPTKAKRDIDNSLAVVSKFTGDALVKRGVLEDDDFKIVNRIVGVYGGIDRDNPRCEVTVKQMSSQDT